MKSLKKVSASPSPYKAKPSSETGSTVQKRITKPSRDGMGNDAQKSIQANGNLFAGDLSSSNNPHSIKNITPSHF